MATSLTLFGYFFVVTTTIVFARPPQYFAEEAFWGRNQVKPSYQQLEEKLRAPRAEEDDYEDFPLAPPFLRLSLTEPENENFKTPGKRYLGIDIPDYISTGAKTEAIKNMSNKMKAMGK